MLRSSTSCVVFASTNRPAYQRALYNKSTPLVLCTGPAGTGKTMEACRIGMFHLSESNYEKMIITRPSVSVDEELGYLPGGMENKMDPWMIPMYEYMEEFSNRATLGKYMKNGIIEVAPLGFLRGRTFHNSIVIADEMQNSTTSQMMNLLTRIGDNSKVIITGDLNQCDLNEKINGLDHFLIKLKSRYSDCGCNSIEHVELTNEDIMRSEFTKLIVNIYDQL